MTYREIIFKLDADKLNEAEAILTMLDCGGLYIEDYRDIENDPTVRQVGLVDEELLKKDRTVGLIHIYADENKYAEDCIGYASEMLTAAGIGFSYEQKDLDEEDYANSWKQYYKPIKVGKKIVVVPAWEEYEAKDGETIMKINPGMAFGTGTHETTFMCAEALQEIVAENDEILDIGCGSGILSVISLLCGAVHADAADIDPNAVKVSVENAELNRVGEKIGVFLGDIKDPVSVPAKELKDKKYDVIVANIVADIIIGLSKTVYEKLKDDGYYIMSGIIKERLDDVVTSLEENGFKVTEIREKKGWNCIISVKYQ